MGKRGERWRIVVGGGYIMRWAFNGIACPLTCFITVSYFNHDFYSGIILASNSSK